MQLSDNALDLPAVDTMNTCLLLAHSLNVTTSFFWPVLIGSNLGLKSVCAHASTNR